MYGKNSRGQSFLTPEGNRCIISITITQHTHRLYTQNVNVASCDGFQDSWHPPVSGRRTTHSNGDINTVDGGGSCTGRTRTHTHKDGRTADSRSGETFHHRASTSSSEKGVSKWGRERGNSEELGMGTVRG